MPDPEPVADLDELAGQLHALTGGIAALKTSTGIDDIATSSTQLALIAARANLDTVLPGLPPPEPPTSGDAQALVAQLRDLSRALAQWAQSASGDEALAAAQAALNVDEAARRLGAILR